MNKLKTYMFLGFVSALMLCMTFCCYKAAFLLVGMALNPVAAHRELAWVFSIIWMALSVACTGLSYTIIKDQWENI
jgi:hypothetical protein